MSIDHLPAMGEIFHILHKTSNRCLVPRYPDTFEKDIITLEKVDPDNLNQLWMI